MKGTSFDARVGVLRALLVLSSLATVIALLAPSVASAAECTDTWTGPVTGGAWGTAANWSGKHVPTGSDVACIGSGNTVKVASGTNMGGVAQGEGGLLISGGSFELTGTGGASEIGSLTMSGGTLKGSGTLTIGKTLSWPSEAWMTGAGNTILASGATASATLGGGAHLEGRHFINEGTFELASGSIRMSEGAELVNSGIFDANSTSTLALYGGPIVNSGTFQKTSGTATTEVYAPIENKGTVFSKEGNLKFVAGGSSTSSAQWESTGGGHVVFGGNNFSLKGGALVGPIAIKGSTFGGSPPLPVVSTEGISGTTAELGKSKTGP
jgi:hypothetical protein